MPFLAMSDSDALVAIVTALLGGGGIFGVVRVWLAFHAKREERADERLAGVLEAAREERGKDRGAERAERERVSDRFDAALQRLQSTFTETSRQSVAATEKLTDEVSGLRADQRAGLACRMADVAHPGAPNRHEARPVSKPGGTRGPKR